MPRKKGSCNVSVEDAAEILGIDAQTLRLCLQRGYYKDIGNASKTSDDSECYVYDISKYRLFERQGLDVTKSVEETIKLIREGNPPFIAQVPKPLIEIWNRMQKEKDALSVERSAS